MDDAREAYWHEGEPRIIASGRWQQDEFGDTTYIPDHVRPSTAAGADGPPVGGDLMDVAGAQARRVGGEFLRANQLMNGNQRDAVSAGRGRLMQSSPLSEQTWA